MALGREYLEGQSTGAKAISDRQAEDAFRTIIKWIGEDPDRRVYAPHFGRRDWGGMTPNLA
jgi:hypothetical protein